MLRFRAPNDGDPSEVQQLFPKYNLEILCCRYWWLTKWEYPELTFPYWRLYYNPIEGASFSYEGVNYDLDAKAIYLIAPNTAYSTRLFNHETPKNKYTLVGGKMTETYEKMDLTGAIAHLFIHFNLGLPFDNIKPGVFKFEVSEHQRSFLEQLMGKLIVDAVHFSFQSYLWIQSLICELLADIDKQNWNIATYDHRILDALSYIENNIGNDLSNVELARCSNLAVNSFTRLFTEEMGVAPQRFVKRKRIDLACIHLHHSDYSIEQIALNTGFVNRYHFTRVFTKLTGVPPARYRKDFGIA